MPKHFEPEVGLSLTKYGGYRHKCPDSKFSQPDKVDYSTISIDGTGWRIEIEAKETSNKEHLPWSEITVHQVAVLRSVNDAGGLGILLVNFHRINVVGAKRSTGVVAVYRWPFMSRYHDSTRQRQLRGETPNDHLKPWQAPALLLMDADLVLPEREVGRTWNIKPLLRRETWATWQPRMV